MIRFHLLYRMASSGLHEMYSIIHFAVDVSQVMFSSTKDLIATTSVVVCAWDSCWSCWLLILSSWMVSRTLSHICGRLYLPMFLLRIGLLTFYVNRFLDWNCKVVPFPTYYTKVLQSCVMACVGLVFLCGWRCHEMFLIPFTKSPMQLPNVLLITSIQSSMDFKTFTKKHPLRPTVSIRGSVTYRVAME